MMTAAILVKAARDASARALLMSAAKGLGIVHEKINDGIWIIGGSGVVYFVFDCIYEGILRMKDVLRIWVLILGSLPLIFMNTLIFFLVFAWFDQIFRRLRASNQTYKSKLLKQFAVVLGISAGISVIWTILEIIVKVFRNYEDIWKWGWLYIGIWDMIFLLMILSLMVIWRINTNSNLLASSHELRNQDDDLASEEESKYGIELEKY